MGIDAGIKPGELYTPRCRLAEVRRVASEQRSEAQKGRSRLREPARYDAALILCTVATPTPTVRAVRLMPTPSLEQLEDLPLRLKDRRCPVVSQGTRPRANDMSTAFRKLYPPTYSFLRSRLPMLWVKGRETSDERQEPGSGGGRLLGAHGLRRRNAVHRNGRPVHT